MLVKRNAFARSRSEIRQDVERVFGTLRDDLDQSRARRRGHDQTSVGRAVGREVRKAIDGNQVLLLDSLINYLSDDAAAALAGANASTMNAFHARNRQWIQLKKREAETTPLTDEPRFSADRRSLHAAGAGAVIAGGTALATKSLGAATAAAVPAALVVGGLAYALTYRVSSQSSRQTLKTETTEYVKRCQADTLDWLLKVADRYQEDFATFCRDLN